MFLAASLTTVLPFLLLSDVVFGASYTTEERHPGGNPINLAELAPLAGSLELSVPVNRPVADANSSTTALFDNLSLVVPTESDTLKVVIVNRTGIVNDRWSPTDTSNPQVHSVITDLHNMYRRKHPASNMLKVKWDEEAATLAQSWVKGCKWGHSKAAERKTSKFSCGQNIARANYQMSWNATLLLWHSQSAHFKFDQNPAGIVGDFTQLVWAKSWQVGCGYKFCAASDQDESFHFYVCNYCPAGNMIPDHYRPFEPSPDRGRVCDKCSGPGSFACDHGLCTNPCEFSNNLTNCDHADGHFPGLLPQGCATDANAQFREDCKATCECKDKFLLY